MARGERLAARRGEPGSGARGHADLPYRRVSGRSQHEGRRAEGHARRRRKTPLVSEPTVAPFGSWSSPITAEMLATGGVGLDEPRIVDGLVFWLESRPSEGGRSVIVAGDALSSARDVIPDGFN